MELETIRELEKKIKYIFKNKEIIEQAVIHKSYTHEFHADNYERLEFLGDTILNMCVAEYIFLNEKKICEGNMTKIRSEVICEDCLYKVACDLEYGKYVLLGNGEEKSGGRDKPSILADIFESITAAIYLDGGMPEAKKFVLRNLTKYIDESILKIGQKDYKTRLQEILQEDGSVKIEYEVKKESGPEHDKTYEISVKVHDRVLGVGIGKNKKDAEQAAAKEAIKKIAL